MDNLLLLPKQLLAAKREIVKAVALLNLKGELIARAGRISDSRLLVVAGRMINSHQGFSSELGWLEEPCQLWAKSSESEFILLSKIQADTYLFLLSNPCLKGQIQSILDVVDEKFFLNKKDNFLVECEKKLCNLIGPVAQILVQKNAHLYQSSKESFLASLERDLHKHLIEPHKFRLFKQQIEQNRSRR